MLALLGIWLSTVNIDLICSNMGLHCEVVSGFAKGADYHPGMKFSDKDGAEGQHSWNVILIDGVWRLVDCHWAARKRVGKQVTPFSVIEYTHICSGLVAIFNMNLS